MYFMQVDITFVFSKGRDGSGLQLEVLELLFGVPLVLAFIGSNPAGLAGNGFEFRRFAKGPCVIANESPSAHTPTCFFRRNRQGISKKSPVLIIQRAERK